MGSTGREKGKGKERQWKGKWERETGNSQSSPNLVEPSLAQAVLLPALGKFRGWRESTPAKDASQHDSSKHVSGKQCWGLEKGGPDQWLRDMHFEKFGP